MGRPRRAGQGGWPYAVGPEPCRSTSPGPRPPQTALGCGSRTIGPSAPGRGPAARVHQKITLDGRLSNDNRVGSAPRSGRCRRVLHERTRCCRHTVAPPCFRLATSRLGRSRARNPCVVGLSRRGQVCAGLNGSGGARLEQASGKPQSRFLQETMADQSGDVRPNDTGHDEPRLQNARSQPVGRRQSDEDATDRRDDQDVTEVDRI